MPVSSSSSSSPHQKWSIADDEVRAVVVAGGGGGGVDGRRSADATVWEKSTELIIRLVPPLKGQ